MKKPIIKEKTTKIDDAWRNGYMSGLKVNEKYTQLGKAIVDILYDFFEPKKEDY